MALPRVGNWSPCQPALRTAAGEGRADVDAGEADADTAARDEPVEALVGVAVGHHDSLRLCTGLCT